MRCSEPLTTCAQGSEQSSSNVLLNSLKTKLYLREPLRVCDSLTHHSCSSRKRERGSFYLLLNWTRCLMAPLCILVCIKAEEHEASKQRWRALQKKKKKKKPDESREAGRWAEWQLTGCQHSSAFAYLSGSTHLAGRQPQPWHMKT